MKRSLSVLCLFCLLLSCRKRYEAPVPSLDWDSFDSPAAIALPNAAGEKTEGIYSISSTNSFLGEEAAAKWTYTADGQDTMYNLSFFCSRDASYIICEGKFQADSTILLNGYWRRMRGTE